MILWSPFFCFKICLLSNVSSPAHWLDDASAVMMTTLQQWRPTYLTNKLLTFNSTVLCWQFQVGSPLDIFYCHNTRQPANILERREAVTVSTIPTCLRSSAERCGHCLWGCIWVSLSGVWLCEPKSFKLLSVFIWNPQPAPQALCKRIKTLPLLLSVFHANMRLWDQGTTRGGERYSSLFGIVL